MLEGAKEEKMEERAGRLGQIRVYTGKFFRIFINERDWKVIVFAVVISALLSLVMGPKMFVEKEFTRTGMFAIVSAMVWIGIFNSIQTVCRERAIIKREHRTGLHITSYVAAHMIYQAVICAVQAVVMIIIYRIFMQFPEKGLVTGNFYVDVFICFFLILYASDMMGLAVSSVVKSTTAAMTVMPFLLIIQLILSGSIFPLSGAARSISNLTISKWGQRVLCIESNLNEIPSSMLEEELEQLRMFDGMDVLIDLVPEETVSDMSAKMTYRKIYEYKAELVTRRWLYLLGFAVVFAAVSVLSLELIDHDKR